MKPLCLWCGKPDHPATLCDRADVKPELLAAYDRRKASWEAFELDESLRRTLPTRRTGGAIDFHHNGIRAVFTVAYACFPRTRRCAEIFLNSAPTLGDIEKSMRDAAILASMALQHGCALDTLIAGVTHEEDGQASSIIGAALILVRDDIASLPPAPSEDPVPPVPQGGTDGDAVTPPERADRIPADHVAAGLVPFCTSCGLQHSWGESCTFAASVGRYLPVVNAEALGA